MGKPYSLDLRKRVVAAIEGGMSLNRATKQFGVAISTAIGWMQRVDETGGVEACQMDAVHVELIQAAPARARRDCPSGRPALWPRGATADGRPKRSPSRHRQTEPAQERRCAAQSNRIASSLFPSRPHVDAHEACLPRRPNDLADNRGPPNLPSPVVFTPRRSAAASVRRRCLKKPPFFDEQTDGLRASGAIVSPRVV